MPLPAVVAPRPRSRTTWTRPAACALALTAVAPRATAGEATQLAAETADGRAVVLNSDGTWAWATASPPATTSAASAHTPSLTLAVVSCDDHENPSIPRYASLQFGLTNSGDRELAKVWVTFNYLDHRGGILTGAEWGFANLRPGKTLVERTLAVQSVRCGDIAHVEITGARCTEATPTARPFDCYDAVGTGRGPVAVRK